MGWRRRPPYLVSAVHANRCTQLCLDKSRGTRAVEGPRGPLKRGQPHQTRRPGCPTLSTRGGMVRLRMGQDCCLDGVTTLPHTSMAGERFLHASLPVGVRRAARLLAVLFLLQSCSGAGSAPLTVTTSSVAQTVGTETAAPAESEEESRSDQPGDESDPLVYAMLGSTSADVQRLLLHARGGGR